MIEMDCKRMWFRCLVMVSLMALTVSESGTARAGLKGPVSTRFALLIGNAEYEGTARLAPDGIEADLAAMEKALLALGFRVMRVEDATLSEMVAAVKVFAAHFNEPGRRGLLYFSGHGFRSGTRDYLVPVDFLVDADARGAPAKALPVDQVLQVMQGTPGGVRVLVLDSDRSYGYGFEASAQSVPGGAMEVKPGTAIAYATTPGRHAEMTPNGAGRFTQELARELSAPVVELGRVLDRTQAAVARASEGRQIPVIIDAVAGELYLRDYPILYSEIKRPVAEAEEPAPDVNSATGGVGREWENSVGMEFAWIPEGELLMGSESEQADDDEKPVTRVEISEGYWMGKHEVTQGEWEAVMGSNPSSFEDCGSDCPVEWVSWEEAQEYIRRLNARERWRGYAYRLPSEAEWKNSQSNWRMDRG